jgi:hypothetical protein
MKYLIYFPESEPFFTKCFDAENHFVDGMVVFNVHQYVYTTDGTTWLPIEAAYLVGRFVASQNETSQNYSKP